ncbi:MAG: hypothetical protein OEZ06_15130 [Myxococcales bacterium]|nr:hypothetical protein [Myxococcales bacterium]
MRTSKSSERGALSALGPLLLLASSAAAQGAPTDGRLMAEPIGYTDVADALDDGDVWDVNVSFRFERTATGGRIERERAGARAADARAQNRFVELGEHSLVRSALQLELELGLYHDLMAFVGVPVVLDEQRRLEPAAGLGCSQEDCPLLSEPLGAADGGIAPLFDRGPNTVSATRSGVPSVRFGLAWSPTNQHRGGQGATWTLRAEGELGTSNPMRACLRNGCDDAGIGSGLDALTLQSRFSYRYRYVAPLFGISHRMRWIGEAAPNYRPGGVRAGVPDDGPPSTTELTLGAAVIPWEDRGRYQRLAIDLRAEAALTGPGRDYSPLFDALGSSIHPQLAGPSIDRAPGGPEPLNASSFTGITRVGSHARLGLRLGLTMRAARYVRFGLGVGTSMLTPHLISGEPACNRAVGAGANDARAGGCLEGIVNPAYRAVIDAPGSRFRVASELQLDLVAAAAAQF